ncbi:hypothetical protein ACK32R_21280 [Aeromonas dhakensis]|uniref:hypothetical protein n=1 Tax=Aeromonas dhakensis TaxID=196024 RepID=UPI003985D240
MANSCGCCGVILEPLNAPEAASGETWSHPLVANCPWSEWEGLSVAQVQSLQRLATLEKLTARLAEDLEFLAESTELDDADRRHVEEMQLLIAANGNGDNHEADTDRV